ncbi:unknown protein [Seminavis robusta]|uniref:Uncharacterized protein n=1 Tax=Seminavis robusta TaxID=568900 RepID=A0A9N8F2N2_9STRA|nr:unknown protein [Seminavis robusta]|eukprot:Sro3660_g350040.1 n/a (174) ;mRNA; r:2999-3520
MKRMTATWSPDQPLEDLFNQVKDAQKYAENHDPISDKQAIRAASDNLMDSGVFTDALRDWDKMDDKDQTFNKLEDHFNEADEARRRILTTKGVGYANKATIDKPTNETSHKVISEGSGTAMYYCWSHGLGTNSNHTSKNCTKKATGHRVEANAADMLGGCCIIRRKAGERAIY